MISNFLQLQQVLDTFIIFSAQQTDSTSQNIEIPSVQSSDNSSSLKLPLMQFSPSNIRIAPFPTREYTDDEFQSIIKKVMGVLYVLLEFYVFNIIAIFCLYYIDQKLMILSLICWLSIFLVSSYWDGQVSSGISLPNLSPD